MHASASLPSKPTTHMRCSANTESGRVGDAAVPTYASRLACRSFAPSNGGRGDRLPATSFQSLSVSKTGAAPEHCSSPSALAVLAAKDFLSLAKRDLASFEAFSLFSRDSI